VILTFKYKGIAFLLYDFKSVAGVEDNDIHIFEPIVGSEISVCNIYQMQ